MEMIQIPGKSFSIGKFPVTVGQYRKFLQNHGYTTPQLWSPQSWSWRSTNSITKPQDWGNGPRKAGDLPITGVSFYEAEAFCNWAGFRLPTGEEWGFACLGRGPDQPENVQDYAWCYENSGGVLRLVGGKKANDYGVFDMLGNCWEWTSEAVGSYRVLRGGGWYYSAYYLRASNRLNDDPTSRIGLSGFRCVASPP